MVPNNDKNRTYAVSYVPKVAGLHKVSLYRLSCVFPTPFTSLHLAELDPSLSSHPTPPSCTSPTRLSPCLALPRPSTPLSELLSSRSSSLASDLQVTVLFAGQNIERSPFEVNVGMALGDANKVSARGPGLEPVGNVANKPTYFDIYTAGGDWPFHQTPHDCSWWGTWGPGTGPGQRAVVSG